jgi:hypothetical protein
MHIRVPDIAQECGQMSVRDARCVLQSLLHITHSDESETPCKATLTHRVDVRFGVPKDVPRSNMPCDDKFLASSECFKRKLLHHGRQKILRASTTAP